MKSLIISILLFLAIDSIHSQRTFIYDQPTDRLNIIHQGDSFYFLQMPQNAITEYKKVINVYREDIYLNQVQNYIEADSLQAAFELLKNMADSQFFFKDVLLEKDAHWDKIKSDKNYVQLLEKIHQNFNIFCEATQVKYPSTMRQLLWMHYIDQKYQYMQMFKNKFSFAFPNIANDSIENLIQKTFIENKDSLDQYISKYGFLGKKEVGVMGADLVWVIIQHADFDLAFQKKCLAAMKIALKNDDCEPSDYAFLTDRILVHENKKQRYGTQMHYVQKTINAKSVKVHELWPVEDPKHLDALRKSMHLIPIKEYLQLMKNLPEQ